MESLRLAAPEVAWIQAAVADGVLLAEPGEEALEAEAVPAVGRGTVPGEIVSNPVCFEVLGKVVW